MLSNPLQIAQKQVKHTVEKIYGNACGDAYCNALW